MTGISGEPLEVSTSYNNTFIFMHIIPYMNNQSFVSTGNITTGYFGNVMNQTDLTQRFIISNLQNTQCNLGFNSNKTQLIITTNVSTFTGQVYFYNTYDFSLTLPVNS